MSHNLMDPIVLDQMYDHPERFTHLSKDEYIKLLIEDIRHLRARLVAAQTHVDAMVDGMGTSYDYRGVSAEAVFELAELLRGEGDR